MEVTAAWHRFLSWDGMELARFFGYIFVKGQQFHAGWGAIDFVHSKQCAKGWNEPLQARLAGGR